MAGLLEVQSCSFFRGVVSTVEAALTSEAFARRGQKVELVGSEGKEWAFVVDHNGSRRPANSKLNHAVTPMSLSQLKARPASCQRSRSHAECGLPSAPGVILDKCTCFACAPTSHQQLRLLWGPVTGPSAFAFYTCVLAARPGLPRNSETGSCRHTRRQGDLTLSSLT
jgi:hypothetical protein